MNKTRNEGYVDRLLSYVLWNEILTGQTMKNIGRLSDAMGIEFPMELLEGPYYLLVTGIERRAYRPMGLDALTYDEQVYAIWLEKREDILKLGYDSAFVMQFYDETRRLVLVLKPVETHPEPPYIAAAFFAETLQAYYEKQFLKGGELKNFSVLSERLNGAQMIAPAFRRLSRLHQCAFFQMEPYVITEELVRERGVHCEQSEVFQKTRELMVLIADGDCEDVQALLEELFFEKVRRSYDVELCYIAANAVIARLMELDDAYRLNMKEELNDFVPWEHATLKRLFERLMELVNRCAQGVHASKLHFSAITRAAITYIHHNYAKAFTLAEIADSVNVAPSYLSRMFNRDVGESIPTYLTRIRIQRAAQQLLETDKPVREIALDVGFLGASYFGRIFKEEMGVTPKVYREQRGYPIGK